jgi:polar amino acid transport system substrate-binding protein
MYFRQGANHYLVYRLHVWYTIGLMISSRRSIVYGMFLTVMRIFCCIVLGSISMLMAPAHAGERNLPIVFEDYPPYEYVENGEVKGINMDLIREAFRRMGVTPFFEPRPWKRALYGLRHGDVLALSSGFKTEKRLKFAIFPTEPLAMETNVVAALSVSGVVVEKLEDLQDLRIGVVRDYAYGRAFDSLTGLHKIMANSSQQMVEMLLAQRMDVCIGNKVVIRHVAQKLGKAAHIRFLYVLGNDPLYLMFSRQRASETQELADEFSQTLHEMRKDGTFERIQGNY